ncbi:kallikrein-7-like [Molossus molossus]|uniref:kallikrein-7-like n=1 Tax=Molossus molossus TaxID=27622 RepID=UPI0017467291|nr:kallikrein-7-like [Molossus molossus]
MGSDLLADGRAQKIGATDSFIHLQFDAAKINHDTVLVKLSSPLINPPQRMCPDVTLISYEDCRGDSGSPLMCKDALQGLVSSGYFPCVPPFYPIIYTGVCKYSQWIYETMKNNF